LLANLQKSFYKRCFKIHKKILNFTIIKFYKEKGKKEERLGRFIEKFGWEEFYKKFGIKEFILAQNISNLL